MAGALTEASGLVETDFPFLAMVLNKNEASRAVKDASATLHVLQSYAAKVASADIRTEITCPETRGRIPSHEGIHW